MIGSHNHSDVKSDFVDSEGAFLIGKHILVGAAHCDQNGAVISREQFHGIIESAGVKEGLVIKLAGSNEKRVVPVDATKLQMARPGEYRLTGTDEIVKDPDYILKLTLHEKGI